MAAMLITMMPVIICCASLLSSLSSLIIFGDKIPGIGPSIKENKNILMGGTASSVSFSACICILAMIMSFWVLNKGVETVGPELLEVIKEA